MTQIHASATVARDAKIGAGVRIGPGCVIEPGVIIGDDCELRANVYVATGTRMGRGNRVFANVVLGEEPQILGAPRPGGELLIGDGNTFRENVNVHRGSAGGSGRTVVGNDTYLMVGAHLGHDCVIEDGAVIGNYGQLSGHVKVERKAWLSGVVAAHQFVTIGRFAYVGGMSGTAHDIPPFVRAAGHMPCAVRGLNVVGLRRNGFAEEQVQALMRAYRRLYRRTAGAALARLVAEMQAEDDHDENVTYLLSFLERSARHAQGRYRELAR